LIERSVGVCRPVRPAAAGNISKTLLTPMRYAVLDLIDAKHVAFANEIGTHSIPIGAEPFEQRIERKTTPLGSRAAALEICTAHRMREGSDCGDKVLNYASKFLTVLPAVVRYRGGFVGAERWTLQDSIAHLVFMRGADSVFVEILQRAVDAVESLRA